MEDYKTCLNEVISDVENYINLLFSTSRILFINAEPPSSPGAYIIYDHNSKLAYVGEAKGSGGLKDRLIRKHLSGDDNHAIQRAYKDLFPDRKERRKFIKQNVSARWVVTKDASSAKAVESVLINMLAPPWNK